MAKKREITKKTQKQLRKKQGYKEALETVKEFLKKQEDLGKKESIKINPYADYPWFPSPKITSEKWSSF